MLAAVVVSCWAGAETVAVVVGCWPAPEVRELATEGSSPKPGLVRLRSSCIAVAAACLVALSSSSDWACRGEPELHDHTHFLLIADFLGWIYVWKKMGDMNIETI
jgi:hypothetical protein